jgi:hypothetical protein
MKSSACVQGLAIVLREKSTAHHELGIQNPQPALKWHPLKDTCYVSVITQQKTAKMPTNREVLKNF